MRYSILLLASAGLTSAVSNATDAVDSSVREYILSRSTSANSDWYEDDMTDLTSRQKEVGKKPKASETSDIKKKISVEKAKLTFLREMRSSAVKKIDQEVINKAILESLQQAKAAEEKKKEKENFATSIKEAEKLIQTSTPLLTKATEDLTKAKETWIKNNKFNGDVNDPKVLEGVKKVNPKVIEDHEKLEQTITQSKDQISTWEGLVKTIDTELKDMAPGVKLENGLVVKTEYETKPDGNKTIKVNLTADVAELEAKKLPRDVKENLTPEEMKKLFDDKVGDDLLSKDFDAAKTDEEIAKDLSGEASRSEMSDTADERIADQRAEIGTKDDPNTKLGQLQEELDEKNGVGRDDEIRDIEAKKKIANYLDKNPSAKDLEPCDLLMKAVGWAALSSASRQECSEKDPRKIAQEKQDKEAQTAEERKIQQQAQAERAKELQELEQHCQALYRQRAMQQATDQVTQPINALMDKLVLQYNSSEMYASLCAPMTGEGLDEFDKAMTLDPKAEAARKALAMMGDPEKLDKEREAVSLVMRRSIYSLEKSGSMMGGAIAANQQTGMLDMAQLIGADAKVQRMGAIYNCSKGILDAIDAAKLQRRMEIDNQLGAGLGGVGVGGMSVAPNGGTYSPNGVQRRSVNNNGQRPATQRRNEILRNGSARGGLRNGAPAPNYMGR